MTLRTIDLCDALADALSYPRHDDLGGLERAAVAAASDAETSSLIDAARADLGRRSHAEREELYTRSFDLNPACSLEVGWHVFGECYDRGGFLVELRALLRERGLRETGELPDHLIHLLPLWARMEEGEAWRFARDRLDKALGCILEGIDEGAGGYHSLLRVVRRAVDVELGRTTAHDRESKHAV